MVVLAALPLLKNLTSFTSFPKFLPPVTFFYDDICNYCENHKVFLQLSKLVAVSL